MKKTCAYLFFFLQALLPLAATTTAQWDGSDSGVWTATQNWTPNQYPGTASGDVANLTNAAPSTATITLGATIKLGTLNIDYLAAGYSISTGNFVFEDPTGNSAINVTTTNGESVNAISSPITITSPLTITQNSTGNLTLSGVISSGALTKAGDGTLVLSATNTYSTTTISAGTISISSSNNLGGGALTIGNGILYWSAGTGTSKNVSLTGSAGLQAKSGVTATMSGVISGSGSLNIGETGGVVVLNKTNTYSGGTIISSGTLIIYNDTNLGNSSGSLSIGNGTLNIVTNNLTIARSGSITGTATIDSATTNTFSGNFSGSGSLTLTGNGTYTFTGTNSYSGGTIIAANTSLTGTTNGIQGNISFSAASAALSFDQNFDGTYAGAISGAAPVTKLGTGTVIFSNISTMTGSTTVSAGTLEVNGAIASSSVSVASGATLGGTGHVGSVTSSGTIDPGSGSTIGRLEISGTLTLNAGMVNINIAPLSTDLITVSGAADITGASLNIDPTVGFYGFSADYTILTTSALTSPFTSVTSSISSFAPTVTYSATAISLHVVISEPFALVTYTNENTMAVGDNFDALNLAGQISSDLTNVINTFIGQGFGTINDALDQMHPAPYSAFTEQQTEMAAGLISLFHRAPTIACGCDAPNRFWVEPFGNILSMQDHGKEVGFHASSGGVALGLDWEIASNWSMGFGGAWNTTHLDWRGSHGRGEVNGFYGSLYSDYRMGGFYIGGAVLSGVDFYETNRNIKFLSVHRHATADFQAIDIVAQIKTAYLFGVPAAFFYPYANLDYIYFHTEAFEEKGADSLNLMVSKRSDGTLRTEMGLGLQVQDTNADETICISPKASLGWVNMAPLQRPLYTAEFAGTTIPFSVRGWKETWNLFNVDFGLSITYYCFRLALDYSVEFSPNSNTVFYNEHGNVHLDWKW